jgi:hypothetical protein
MLLKLSDDERTVLTDIQRTGAFRTTEDAVLGALFWYARFLDLDPPIEVFALRLPESQKAALRATDASQPSLFANEGD